MFRLLFLGSTKTSFLELFFVETEEMTQFMDQGGSDLPGQLLFLGIVPPQRLLEKGDPVGKHAVPTQGPLFEAQALEKAEEVVPGLQAASLDLPGAGRLPHVNLHRGQGGLEVLWEVLQDLLDDLVEKRVAHIPGSPGGYRVGEKGEGGVQVRALQEPERVKEVDCGDGSQAEPV